MVRARGAAAAQPLIRAGVAALGAVALAACGSDQAQAPQRITVSSPAFAGGASIPRQYTCDGRDISLPLKWSGVPDDATELRLMMIDPDAPGGSFIHWQLSGLSPRSGGLDAGRAPEIGNAGTNGFGTTGYRGPCPPRGSKPHHYVITVTAFGSGRIVGSGTLTGTYGRG
jgi:Raf kinase inhibitor-like YbhB/YbcL family protein